MSLPTNKPIYALLPKSHSHRNENSASEKPSAKRNWIGAVALFAVVLIPAAFVLIQTSSTSEFGDENMGEQLNITEEDSINYFQTGDIWGSAAVHSIATVKRFLANGTDVNAQNPYDGSTAMHSAAEFGRLGMIKFLLSKGANPNIRAFEHNENGLSLYGQLPVHAAAQWDRTEVVEFLLSLNGSSVHVKDARGWTPLHYAAFNNNLPTKNTIIALLKLGANPSAKDNQGKLPLDVAIAQNHQFKPPEEVKPDIVELLTPKTN